MNKLKITFRGGSCLNLNGEFVRKLKPNEFGHEVYEVKAPTGWSVWKLVSHHSLWCSVDEDCVNDEIDSLPEPLAVMSRSSVLKVSRGKLLDEVNFLEHYGVDTDELHLMESSEILDTLIENHPLFDDLEMTVIED